MKLIRFLRSKTFWANVVVSIILGVLLLFGINSFLAYYTRHGENIKVPDLSTMSLSEIEKELRRNQLRFEVIDSSEFNPNYPRFSVIAQYPDAGSFVKEGRVIRLTLNPGQARKVAMPDLVEKTKRRAIYDLNSTGFSVGELKYVPYIGKDVVIKASVDDQTVKAGQLFRKGTVVDLTLGQGLSTERVTMPYLRWKNLEEAKNSLLASSLNLGSVIYDEEITDTALALVYRQNPEPTLEPAINMGREVDLWLTNDYTKIPNDSLKFQLDSLRIDSLLHDSLP
jgi:beta-lactam-binding protein with PASTA domain